jgi:hypothetical protein
MFAPDAGVIVAVAGRTTMAYDENLADRIRALLEDEADRGQPDALGPGDLGRAGYARWGSWCTCPPGSSPG